MTCSLNFCLDCDSRESWHSVSHFFNLFGPSLVDEDCCSVSCFAVSCCSDGGLIHSSSFLLSPSLVNRDKVPVTVFANQRTCFLLYHRDCDRVVVFAFSFLRVVWVVVLCS